MSELHVVSVVNIDTKLTQGTEILVQSSSYWRWDL